MILDNRYIHLFSDNETQWDYEGTITSADTYVSSYLIEGGDLGEVHYDKRYYIIGVLDVTSDLLNEPIEVTSNSFRDANSFDWYVDGVKILSNNSGSTHSYGLIWQFETVGRHVFAYEFYSPECNTRLFDCHNISTLIISPYMKKINSSFSNLYNLKHLAIPYNVNDINGDALRSCTSLESIIVDERNVKYTSMDANGNECNAVIDVSNNHIVVGCKNTVIPDTITGIDNNAFYGCNGLTSIHIHSGITGIGSSSFAECYNVSAVTVDSDNPVYDSRNNCNAVISKSDNKMIVGCKNTVIPSNVKSFGGFALFCQSIISTIIICYLNEITI